MIDLCRFAYSPLGTFGIIRSNNKNYYTVELPWKGNQPNESCVPEGLYNLTWYDSPTFGSTLALDGRTVSLHPDKDKERSYILFHAANTVEDLEGCIGLGRDLGCVYNTWGIKYSSNSTKSFLREFNDPDMQLNIVFERCGYG